MEEGYTKGETCNRDNCKGIIQEHDSDYGCSCHISPPCSYCETSREYCPECGWDGHEEQNHQQEQVYKNSYNGFGNKQMHDDYYERQAKQDEFNKKFEEMFRGKVYAEKLIVVRLSHSNSSMKVKGVFPKGSETRKSISENKDVQGTFGGRFEYFTEHSFIYIAYTD